jgi:pyruvate dehydrogenase E1 component
MPYVAQCLQDAAGVFVAASDYVKALPDSIDRWLPRPMLALGTDGFGRSDTRAALRNFFEVDAKHIVVAALAALEGSASGASASGTYLAADAVRRYGIDAGARPPWQR